MIAFAYTRRPDHAALLVPNGSVGGDRNGDGRADDRFIVMPAVVALGLVALQRLCLCFWSKLTEVNCVLSLMTQHTVIRQQKSYCLLIWIPIKILVPGNRRPYT
jgi:hypothetical protein